MNTKIILTDITVFYVAFLVMTMELVSTRILAPYFGSSIMVWSSLIATILLTSAIGYYLGAYAAERKKITWLWNVLTIASLVLIAVAKLKGIMLPLISGLAVSTFTKLIGTSLVMFGVPTGMLSTTSAFITRESLTQVKGSYKILSKYYLLTTLGSVIGTLATGFYLLPYFGHGQLLIVGAYGLLLLNLATQLANHNKKWWLVIAIAFSSLLIPNKPESLIDIDSHYHRLLVENFTLNQKNYIGIRTSKNGYQSIVFQDGNDIAYRIARNISITGEFVPKPKNIAVIGAGGLVVVNTLHSLYPEALIDGVEIDKTMVRIAEKYLNLHTPPNTTIHYQDGKAFLQQQSKRMYDIVVLDAFNDSEIPFHLITLESLQDISKLLSNNGVLTINAVAWSKNDQLIAALYNTLHNVFPSVRIYVQPNKDSLIGNVILVASRHKFEAVDSEKYSLKEWSLPLYSPITLTDEYAPVEWLGKTL